MTKSFFCLVNCFTCSKPFEEKTVNNHSFRHFKQFVIFFKILAKCPFEKRFASPNLPLRAVQNRLNCTDILSVPMLSDIVAIVRIVLIHTICFSDRMKFHRERVYTDLQIVAQINIDPQSPIQIVRMIIEIV